MSDLKGIDRITNKTAIEWAKTASLPCYLRTQTAGFGQGVKVMTLIKHLMRLESNPPPYMSEERRREFTREFKAMMAPTTPEGDGDE